MDPTLEFLSEQDNQCWIENAPVWDFFIPAFYRKPVFGKWVAEDSLWDWYLLHKHDKEDYVRTARERIIDFEQEFYKEVAETK